MTLTARRLGGSSRLPDLTALRALMEDPRQWVQEGVVWRENGQTHFEEYVEDGQVVEILVDVKLMPSEIPVTCRLAGLGGGPGMGIWAIPPVGALVEVTIPRGNLDAGCILSSVLSSNAVPDGLGPTTYVVCVPPGGQLLVHDGTASQAVPLATKADVQRLRDELETFRLAYNGHTHGNTTPVGEPTLIAAPPYTAQYTSPDGTAVLKAK